MILVTAIILAWREVIAYFGTATGKVFYFSKTMMKASTIDGEQQNRQMINELFQPLTLAHLPARFPVMQNLLPKHSQFAAGRTSSLVGDVA